MTVSDRKKYLFGKRALDYWKIPNFRGVLEPEGIDFPSEYVFFTQDPIYRPQATYLHTCRIKGAEKYTTQDGVCTLPLVFMQVAPYYNIQQLIFLGLQICSYRGGQPICTVKDLYKCAKQLKGHRGRQKALRAIRYLDNGSRSPMESILYMFLRLPNALGGCGFTQIRLNEKIILKKKGKVYYADLCIPSSKLIIEYDSWEHHDSATAYSKDSMRAANLESEGYRVISVKPKQLSTIKAFETLSKNIARLLKKRIRIRARKFFDGFVALYDILTKGSKRTRSRFKKVESFEVPDFPGVARMYTVYVAAWKRLIAYPDRSLVLTRAP